MQELLRYLTVCCLLFLTLEWGHYAVYVCRTAFYFASTAQQLPGKLKPWLLYVLLMGCYF